MAHRRRRCSEIIDSQPFNHHIKTAEQLPSTGLRGGGAMGAAAPGPQGVLVGAARVVPQITRHVHCTLNDFGAAFRQRQPISHTCVPLSPV